MNRDTHPSPGVDPAPTEWHKSSRSSVNADCVEINLAQPDFVRIRDSKDRGSGPTLAVTPRQWATLIDHIASTTPSAQHASPGLAKFDTRAVRSP